MLINLGFGEGRERTCGFNTATEEMGSIRTQMYYIVDYFERFFVFLYC
jgi:hypothetical protein